MSFWATGIMAGATALSAGMTYMGQQQQADAMAAQAELDQQQARLEADEDAKAEQSRVKAMRDEQRRNRAAIEAGYAASGVVLEGSAGDILTKQAEIDELNVQREHSEGNRRRQLMEWGSGEQAKMDRYAAKSRSRAAGMSLVAGLGQSAATGVDTYKTWV